MSDDLKLLYRDFRHGIAPLRHVRLWSLSILSFLYIAIVLMLDIQSRPEILLNPVAMFIITAEVMVVQAIFLWWTVSPIKLSHHITRIICAFVGVYLSIMSYHLLESVGEPIIGGLVISMIMGIALVIPLYIDDILQLSGLRNTVILLVAGFMALVLLWYPLAEALHLALYPEWNQQATGMHSGFALGSLFFIATLFITLILAYQINRAQKTNGTYPAHTKHKEMRAVLRAVPRHWSFAGHTLFWCLCAGIQLLMMTFADENNFALEPALAMITLFCLCLAMTGFVLILGYHVRRLSRIVLIVPLVFPATVVGLGYITFTLANGNPIIDVILVILWLIGSLLPLVLPLVIVGELRLLRGIMTILILPILQFGTMAGTALISFWIFSAIFYTDYDIPRIETFYAIYALGSSVSMTVTVQFIIWQIRMTRINRTREANLSTYPTDMIVGADGEFVQPLPVKPTKRPIKPKTTSNT